MARLQILQLPQGSGDDQPPFALVVDQCTPQRIALGADAPYRDYWQELAGQIGARGVIVTPEVVELPTHMPLAASGAHLDGRAGTTEIVYAHERTRLDLCSALLLDSGTPWRKLIEQVTERQRELSGLYRKLDAQVGLIAMDPKVADLARRVLAIDLTVACPSDVEGALYNACRELEKSEAARAHLRAERDALAARIQHMQAAPTEPEAMNSNQERPDIWRHGYRCGVLAARSATQPRDEKTSKS